MNIILTFVAGMVVLIAGLLSATIILTFLVEPIVQNEKELCEEAGNRWVRVKPMLKPNYTYGCLVDEIPIIPMVFQMDENGG